MKKMTRHSHIANTLKRAVLPVTAVVGGLALWHANSSADAAQPKKTDKIEFIVPRYDKDHSEYEAMPITGVGWPKEFQTKGIIKGEPGTHVSVTGELVTRTKGRGHRWHIIRGHGQRVVTTDTVTNGVETATSTIEEPIAQLSELSHNGANLLDYRETYTSTHSGGPTEVTTVQHPVGADNIRPEDQHAVKQP